MINETILEEKQLDKQHYECEFLILFKNFHSSNILWLIPVKFAVIGEIEKITFSVMYLIRVESAVLNRLQLYILLE